MYTPSSLEIVNITSRSGLPTFAEAEGFYCVQTVTHGIMAK